MYIVIGVLFVIVLILICILISYQRQVKDICRQLYFLRNHDTNMLITKELNLGNIEELTKLLNELLKERKKERIENVKKEKMIADTYTNLSHDIRTPLTSLDGYFQLLETAEDEADRKRYIQIIQERIASLNEMLEELFTYTKLQNETYTFPLERVNINHLLKETVFSYYDNWTAQGIAPKFDIAKEPIYIRGNVSALRRIIQNIIKNGLDHGNKEIEIQLLKNRTMAELVFKNQVPEDLQIDVDRIFERFYKADKARSKNSTGLGLSIAKGFVEKMDGEITAKAEAGWFEIKVCLRCFDY